MKATKNDLLLRLPRRRCAVSVRWANATKIILLLRSDICGGHGSATGVVTGSCTKKPAPGPADKSRRTGPHRSAVLVVGPFGGPGGCFTGGPLCVIVSLSPLRPPAPPPPWGAPGSARLVGGPVRSRRSAERMHGAGPGGICNQGKGPCKNWDLTAQQQRDTMMGQGWCRPSGALLSGSP